jgi:hypothetical protein
MISLDGPAQVNDGGRRRDGGAGFAIVFFLCGSEDERRETVILCRQIKPAVLPFNHLADALGVSAISSRNFDRRCGAIPRRRFSLR